MPYSIYRYTFPNGKIYIGKTKTTIEQRAGSNGCRYGVNTLVGKAIHKYGWLNVKKEILRNNLSEFDANQMERQLIKQYDANNREVGYNLTRGGDGGATVGHKVSEETRRKIGERNKVANKGKKLSSESVERLRKSLTGHAVSQETREKIRQANLGKRHSEETRRKLSEINRNRDPEIIERMKMTLKKSQKVRTEKRLATMRERYPNGFVQTTESNVKRSNALRGRCKSDETKQKMRKPKSPEAVENMRIARKRSYEARKLGLTYKEYLERIGGN